MMHPSHSRTINPLSTLCICTKQIKNYENKMSMYTQLYDFFKSISFIKFSKSLINHTTLVQQICATTFYNVYVFV